MILREQNGFTIVETLVAAVIATTIAYASFSIFPFLRKGAAVGRGSAACKNYLSENFSRIEKFGTAPRIGQPVIASSSSTVPYVPGAMGVSSSDLSPKAGQPIVQLPSGSYPAISSDIPDLRTAGMYMSSVTLVNAIYANRPTVCSAGISFDTSTLNSSTTLTPPPPDIAAGFTVLMKIQPVNLSTRAIQACTDPGFTQDSTLQIAPKGLALNGTQMQNSGVGKTDARNNVGYQVSLTANYFADGISKSCTESRIIEYTADLVPPAVPFLGFVYDTTSSATAWGPASATLTSTYAGEEGSTLLCIDHSTFTPQTPDPAKVGILWTTDPVTFNYGWLPCEKVTVCGRQPLGAPTTITGTPGSFTIQTHWANQLPYGCHVSLDAVAVDPAGNVSAQAHVNQTIVDPYPSGAPACVADGTSSGTDHTFASNSYNSTVWSGVDSSCCGGAANATSPACPGMNCSAVDVAQTCGTGGGGGGGGPPVCPLGTTEGGSILFIDQSACETAGGGGCTGGLTYAGSCSMSSPSQACCY